MQTSSFFLRPWAQFGPHGPQMCPPGPYMGPLGPIGPYGPNGASFWPWGPLSMGGEIKLQHRLSWVRMDPHQPMLNKSSSSAGSIKQLKDISMLNIEAQDPPQIHSH